MYTWRSARLASVEARAASTTPDTASRAIHAQADVHGSASHGAGNFSRSGE